MTFRSQLTNVKDTLNAIYAKIKPNIIRLSKQNISSDQVRVARTVCPAELVENQPTQKKNTTETRGDTSQPDSAPH